MSKKSEFDAIPSQSVEPPLQVGATYVEGDSHEEEDLVYGRRHEDLNDAGRWVRFVREGGMGAVVEVAGEDVGDGSGLRPGEHRFALKMVKNSLLDRPAIVDRFRRELASHRRLTVDLQATRLVPCLVARSSDQPAEVFGLFPFYPEGSLENCLDRGLDKDQALFVVADAVEGLQSLHGHRYVHRDFHPSNILVETEGGRLRGVLGDLGVGMFQEANTIFSPDHVAHDRKHRVGHPGYIDPHFRASPQADLYAVGITVYRILTGSLPAPVVEQAVKLPQDGDFPLALRSPTDDFLERLTTPRISERFVAAREVRDAVVRLAEKLPGSGSRVSLPTATPVASRSAGVPVSPARTSKDSGDSATQRPVRSADLGKNRRPAVSRYGVGGGQLDRRRRRWLAVPLAAVIFATVGYGGWRLTRDGDDSPVPPHLAASSLESPMMDAGVLPEVDGSSVENAEKTPESRPGSEEAPTTRTPRGPRKAVSFEALSEADKALAQRRYERAEKLLEDLWQQNPGDPLVAGRLASLWMQRDPKAGLGIARGFLSESLELHPKRGEVRVQLAKVLHDLGLTKDAVRLLEKAPRGSSDVDEIETWRVILSQP